MITPHTEKKFWVFTTVENIHDIYKNNNLAIYHFHEFIIHRHKFKYQNN